MAVVFVGSSSGKYRGVGIVCTRHGDVPGFGGSGVVGVCGE